MYLNHKLHNSQQFGYKGEEGNRITDRFLSLLLLYPFCGKQGLFHTSEFFCLFVCCCYVSGEESWLLLWGKGMEMCFFVLQTGGLCQLSRNYEINPLVPVMDSTLRQLQILLLKIDSRGALHKLMEEFPRREFHSSPQKEHRGLESRGKASMEHQGEAR